MTTSASGARIQGDDYQHLYAWYHALRMMIPDHDVVRVEVESYGSGNVDDVVVRRSRREDEYVQVKYSVDASRPVSSEWLMTASSPNGKSPLQRFVASWQLLKAKGVNPQMTLFTNRVLDSEDPILRLRDGQRGVLGPRLALEKARSEAGKQRRRWAEHAGIAEAELMEMLGHLALRTDQGAWSALSEAAGDRMRSVGLRAHETDVEVGIAAIRSWVKDGIRDISRELLTTEVERRGLRGDRQYATLLVEAIDHAAWPDAAQVRVDWVDLFVGSEPRARRQLADPAQWSSKIRPEMVAAARKLKSAGSDRVLVRGYMRLPLWFLAGVELPDTRGHDVACFQRGQWWASDVPKREFGITKSTTTVAQGSDLAVGVSVTNRLGADVVAYCKQVGLPVSTVVEISPAAGPAPGAISDSGHAVGWALATRDAIREVVREEGAQRIHLFMSGPAGGALMLGHIWNRMGPTLVYEDLSPGYAPTYDVP
jgi:hypothetical protein